jgi:hypothetical protein
MIMFLFLLSLPTGLRGHTFHNLLVKKAVEIFTQQGFTVYTEFPFPTIARQRNFVDLVVCREKSVLLCEIETSARHVTENAAKAQIVNLPLWVVVPNRNVQLAVAQKLDPALYRPGGRAIQIPMISELSQRVIRCFPYFPLANRGREHGNTKNRT